MGATQYADKYGVNANPNYLIPSDGDDCTNFVSQCIYEGGGLPSVNDGNRKDNVSWYYSTILGLGYYASYTWGGATNFQWHWGTDIHGNGEQDAYESIEVFSCEDALENWNYLYSNLYDGDVVQLIDPQKGTAYHSTIVDNQSDWNSIYQVSDIDIAEHTPKNVIQKSLYDILIDKVNNNADDELIIERISEET
ncbi:amidase domain-containing protein [Ethanoligenens sp.]|uniref:amidase domain-containing protein n=1 Tax=Ethanoligenens sp. TaxID=2099655 RepID=UPI0039E89481